MSLSAFFQKADPIIGKNIPSMRGYYLKQALSIILKDEGDKDERLVQDKIYENYQCQQCGIYFGPNRTRFRVKSKRRKKKQNNSTYIQLECLNCKMIKTIPLKKSCVKRNRSEDNEKRDVKTPTLATKLFSANSSYQVTPEHLGKEFNQTTPSSIDLPIIDKPSKSAKKMLRMKPKTLAELNKTKKNQREPDLFSFLSSV